MARSHRGAAAAFVSLAAALAGPRLARAQSQVAEGFLCGTDVAVASVLGDAGQGVGLGYTVTPSIGYELAFGVAPIALVSYSRWGASPAGQWQLAGQAGVRWTAPRPRWRPSAEVAVGWGQLVHANGLTVDIGVRSSAGVGLEAVLSDSVRAGLRLRLERLDSSDRSTLWLESGLAVTFLF